MTRSGSLKPALWIFGGCFVAMMAVLLVAVMITAYLKGPRQWIKMVADLEARGEPVWIEDLDWEEPDPSTSFFGVPPFDALWQPRDRWEVASRLSEMAQFYPDSSSRDSPGDPGLRHGRPFDFFAAFSETHPSLESNEDAVRLVSERFEENAEFMDALERAIARPHGALPRIDAVGRFYDTNDHIFLHLRLAFTLRWRGLMHLEMGQPEQAAHDTRLLLQFSQSMEVFGLMGWMIQITPVQFAMEVIWQGIHYEAWSLDQLEEFQQTLASIDRRKAFVNALVEERTWLHSFGTQFLPLPQDLRKFARTSKGNPLEVRQNFSFMGLVSATQLNLDWSEILSQDPAVPLRQEFFPEPVDQQKRKYSEAILVVLNRSGHLDAFLPTELLGDLTFSTEEVFHRVMERCAKQQSLIDMTILACAVERYRLSEGTLPATLEDLVPDWLAELPPDICTGDPYYYQVLPGDGFMLWSQGYRNHPPAHFNPALYDRRTHQALMFLRD